MPFCNLLHLSLCNYLMLRLGQLNEYTNNNLWAGRTVLLNMFRKRKGDATQSILPGSLAPTSDFYAKRCILYIITSWPPWSCTVKNFLCKSRPREMVENTRVDGQYEATSCSTLLGHGDWRTTFLSTSTKRTDRRHRMAVVEVTNFLFVSLFIWWSCRSIQSIWLYLF